MKDGTIIMWMNIIPTFPRLWQKMVRIILDAYEKGEAGYEFESPMPVRP